MIEAADSGHPGTPIGIAPVTYTLWQRFLRFDPADPIWPNRDRYVLSSGHASSLLWSMLHLTGVQAVDPDYEILGEPAVSLDDIKRFRQLDSKCPGHPEYRWTSGVETTTGPLGQGVATSVGMAVASQWLGARYNRDGHALRLRRLRPARGRLHDGGRHVRGRLVRGTSAPLEPVLDLRLEPGDDRGPHGHHVHRGRRRALPRLRLERRDGRGRERPRPRRARVPRVQGRGRAPDAHPRPQPHRLRHAGRGHAQGARRAARARRRARGEALLRLARGRDVPRPRRRLRALRRGHRARGREAREAWEATFAAYREAHPDLADEIERMQRRDLPDGLGRGDPDVPGRPEGPREPRLERPGAQRRRRGRAVAVRRRRRPRALDEDAPDVRRRRRLPARTIATAATSTSASASTPPRRSRTA